MPKYKFGDEENQQWELLKEGDYRYEVVKVDFGIQTGGKTGGSDNIDVSIMIYGDSEFTQKIGRIIDRLIFHPTCYWVIDTFVKSSNLLVDSKTPTKDTEIEFSEDQLIGLRGWCHVFVDKFTRKTGETGEKNKVKTWITNKEKLAKAPKIATEDIPVKTTAGEDDLPF